MTPAASTAWTRLSRAGARLARRAASRAGNQGLARSLGAMRGEHFIDFNPAGQGLAVEVIGNLAQATLAVVTFGIAQVGLALLLRERLARWMRHPVAWAAVATANLSAMTLFLWHQTAFLTVTMTGLLAGRLPGLHTAPTSAVWVAERIARIPVFAMALAILLIVFRHAERAPRQAARAAGLAPWQPARAAGRSGTADTGQAAGVCASAASASTSISRAVAGGSGGSP